MEIPYIMLPLILFCVILLFTTVKIFKKKRQLKLVAKYFSIVFVFGYIAILISGGLTELYYVPINIFLLANIYISLIVAVLITLSKEKMLF